ncbi:endonuclease/exonuclease/phosphatase family protein [Cellulomonas sp. URHB0016]
MSARRVATWATAVVVGAVGVGLAVPVLSGVFPVAQLVAFRAVLALAGVGCALALLAVPWVRRRTVPVVVALALGVGLQAAVLAARAVPAGQDGAAVLARGGAPATGPAGDEGVVVLSFNTLDTVPADTLAALIEGLRADVVVLPETSRATAVATAALLDAAGLPMQLHSADGSSTWIAGTALLVSPALGTYPSSTELPTRLGGVRTVPVDPSDPTLVAAHPLAPGHRSAMPTWRSETAWVADQCASTPGAVVAGDLNATLDHPGLQDLGPCVDAARQAGEAWRGTWPASAPSGLAAPIDHVLVDGRRWRVTAFEVLPPTGGSDHRPIVARLVRR